MGRSEAGKIPALEGQSLTETEEILTSEEQSRSNAASEIRALITELLQERIASDGQDNLQDWVDTALTETVDGIGGWYLIAWCRLREDHRLFRLSRIRTAEGIGEGFTPKEVPMGMLLPDPNEPPLTLTVLAEPKLRYLLEEQGALVTDEMPDGRLKAQLQFASEKQCLAWALSLGSDVEVIEPQSVRQEILRQARVILQRETQQQKQP